MSDKSELKPVDVPERDQVATFETDELTANCPFDFGGPDFYTLTIRYVADGSGIESKSLKLYIESFRNREATAETLADEIYGDLTDAISPKECYVRLEQQRRGGIEETVEVGDYELRR